MVTGPRKTIQVGRNDPCPCGSGKKYKDCCVSKGDAFLQKLGQKAAKQEAKEAKRLAKERKRAEKEKQRLKKKK